MKFLASHESSTRGTFDFPIELYYVDKMHPRYEMPFHWHMEFELLFLGLSQNIAHLLAKCNSGLQNLHLIQPKAYLNF